MATEKQERARKENYALFTLQSFKSNLAHVRKVLPDGYADKLLTSFEVGIKLIKQRQEARKCRRD